MVSMMPGRCRGPLTAVALAFGIWTISGSSAIAQGGGGMGGGGGMSGSFGGMNSMMGASNGMGGMGQMGAFGMSGVTAGGLGGVGPTSGMGRMSGLDGMGSMGGYSEGLGSSGSGIASGYGLGGYGYGYGQTSGYGYLGSGYIGGGPSFYGRGTGGGYGGSRLGYSDSFLGYSYGAYASSLYGSAPGNYYYPYSNPISLTSGAGFGYSSAYVAPGAGAGTVNWGGYQGRYLGIDEEPVVDAGGRKGMKVAKVYPGTAAETAGLRVGDVIHSINGYLTEQRGNLSWIIANAAYNNVLKIVVHKISDGLEHTVTAHLP
jgi:hypothetical protein